MIPAQFYSLVLLPSVAQTRLPDTPASRVLLTAFAGQESGWTNRLQLGGGPGRSFWQIGMTAILDVLARPVLGPGVLALCASRAIPSDPTTIYEAIAWNDLLAYDMARRILLADPAPLPAVGDVEGAWSCYIRNWRPGLPRPDTWDAVYAQSLAVVK